MGKPDLTAPEQDVMLALTQGRVVASATTLAADLWRTSNDWSANDLEPFILFVLDELSAKGLVVFRVNEHERYPLPHNIRLTKDGWAFVGYPNRSGEVGSWSRHDAPPRHFHDRTEYRSHHYHAEGGAIETQDFPTHRFNYPHHVHDYGDIQHMNEQITTSDGKVVTAQGRRRPYVHVTPEIEAMVLAAQHRLGGVISYDAIADETGIPARSVKYILTDLPRLRRAEAGEDTTATSLKARIWELIRGFGPNREIKDVMELRRLLGQSDDEHSIVHVLHGLHADGKVDFTERGNGMGTATLVNIHQHKRAPKPKPEPEPEVARETPEVEVREMVEVVTVTPVYPLLHALAEREWRRVNGDSKANAYLTAATALEHVDPDAARDMMAKAEALAEPFPSPIEAEYLRYATNNNPPTTE